MVNVNANDDGIGIMQAPTGWSSFQAGDAAGLHRAITGQEGELHIGLSIFAALIEKDQHGEGPGRAALKNVESTFDSALNQHPDYSYWLKVEIGALSKGRDQNKWMARADILEAILQPHSDVKVDPWVIAYADGRRLVYLAEAIRRSGSDSNSKKVEGLLDAADEAFSPIEGAAHCKGVVNIVRGRVYSWRNDLDQSSMVLISALAQFGSDQNRIREAEAAYELGVLYLDLNRCAIAEQHLTRAVEAFEASTEDKNAISRARQSRARSRVALASIGYEDRIPGAITDAITSFSLSHAGRAPAEITFLSKAMPLLKEIGKTTGESDKFRAPMAARDLVKISLLRAETAQAEDQKMLLDCAIAWMAVACKEAGFEAAVNADGKTNLTDVVAEDADEFTLIRLRQTESEIALFHAASVATIALIDLGKTFMLRSEYNYVIECWLAAADAFAQRAERATDLMKPNESERYQSSANYWRFRAQLIASSIGYSMPFDSRKNVVSALGRDESDWPRAIAEALRTHNATMIAVLARKIASISMLVAVRGTSFKLRLTVFRHPSFDKTCLKDLIDLSRDRGDIPMIVAGSDITLNGQKFWSIVDEYEPIEPFSEYILGSVNLSKKLTILARIVRAVANLKVALPQNERLFFDPTRILVEPGDRVVLSRFAPIHGVQAVTDGWDFMYPNDLANTSIADEYAVARLVYFVMAGDPKLIKEFSANALQNRARKKVRDAFDRVQPALIVMLSEILNARQVNPEIRAIELPSLFGLANELDKAAANIEIGDELSS